MVKHLEDAARCLLPWLSAASAAAFGMLVWPPLGAISLAGEALLDVPWRRVPASVRPLRRLGDYRLIARLGGGAMGEVWRAEHEHLGRAAAVKLIRAERLTGARRRAARLRFEREARAMARLSSPHTVTVFDYGVAEDGTCFYAMELLDGLDLETLVERRGPLSPARTVHVLRQVCEALEEAHQQGLIHRDLKPANVVLCRRGLERDVAKVLDFGVAVHPLAASDPRATGHGLVVGTPAVMAPEVIRGGPADARSDVYSLGCVAYWLLTGRYPFESGDAHATFAMHVGCDPVPPSRHMPCGAIPGLLEGLVLACLEKEPWRRPEGMGELRRRLARAAQELEPWTREVVPAGSSTETEAPPPAVLVPPRADRDTSPMLLEDLLSLRVAG